MKGIIKHYYRDILTGVLMTISLSFTFFLVLNCVRLIGLINEENIIDGYVKEMNVYTDELYDAKNEQEEREFEELSRKADLFDILKENSCNISLYNSALNSKSREGTLDVQYVISYNEKFNRKIIEGELPNEDFDNGCVLITESVLDVTEVIDGKRYIELDDDKYQISGIIRDVSVAQSEQEVIMFVDAMTEEQKAKVISVKKGNKWTNIHIGSNTDEPLQAYRSINKKLSEYGLKLVSNDRVSHSNIEEHTRYMNKVMQPIMVIFAFLNVFVVTGIWIKQRLKECAIRKSFGATHGMIMKHLMNEMLKCVFVAFIIGAIIQIIYIRITNAIFDLSLYISKISVMIILGVFFIIFAMLGYYGRYIKRTEPITAIKMR